MGGVLGRRAEETGRLRPEVESLALASAETCSDAAGNVPLRGTGDGQGVERLVGAEAYRMSRGRERENRPNSPGMAHYSTQQIRQTHQSGSQGGGLVVGSICGAEDEGVVSGVERSRNIQPV